MALGWGLRRYLSGKFGAAAAAAGGTGRSHVLGQLPSSAAVSSSLDSRILASSLSAMKCPEAEYFRGTWGPRCRPPGGITRDPVSEAGCPAACSAGLGYKAHDAVSLGAPCVCMSSHSQPRLHSAPALGPRYLRAGASHFPQDALAAEGND